METYFLKDDIKLICVNAKSFPDGITDAFDRLNQIIGSTDKRKRYGISRGAENGAIIYKAAMEELREDNELQRKMEKFVIRKGEYIGTRIVNYPDHMESIGKTFEKLLTNPRLDPNSYCVEIYLNEKDVRCMVRLVPKNKKDLGSSKNN